MDDRVDAIQPFRIEIQDVAVDQLRARIDVLEPEETRVNDPNLVATVDQEASQDGPYIPGSPGNQDPQIGPCVEATLRQAVVCNFVNPNAFSAAPQPRLLKGDMTPARLSSWG